MIHVKKSQGVRSLGSTNKSVKVNVVQVKESEKMKKVQLVLLILRNLSSEKVIMRK
jgi:hypothetical protein